jgi:replication fork protection complex subunit Tof1/Swi1
LPHEFGIELDTDEFERDIQIEGNRLKDMLELEARQTIDLFGLKGSRHSRFGTTIAVQSGVSSIDCLSISSVGLIGDRRTSQDGKKYILHKQSTLAEGPEKTMDKVKKSKAKKVRQDVCYLPRFLSASPLTDKYVCCG